MDEYIDFLPTCSSRGKTLSCVVDVAPAMEDITVGQDIRYLKVKGYEIVPCRCPYCGTTFSGVRMYELPYVPRKQKIIMDIAEPGGW